MLELCGYLGTYISIMVGYWYLERISNEASLGFEDYY